MMMFDVLIKGGTVVVGSGAAPQIQNGAIKDGRIVAVASFVPGDAHEVVNARGLDRKSVV